MVARCRTASSGSPPPSDATALLPPGWSSAAVARRSLPVLGQPAARSTARFDYRADYLGSAGHGLRPFQGEALSPQFYVQHAYQDSFSQATGRARLGVISAYNRIKALPLFRNVVEAVPASLRTRAYRFLASGG